MKGSKTIQADQIAKKWDFWSIRPPKWPPLTSKDPLWRIPSFQTSLARSGRTYPNIRSWSAAQMNGLKTIQADQMAEKWDFWSIRPPKWPPWTCKDPLWGIPSFQTSLARSRRTYPNIRSWSAAQMNGLKTIQVDQMAEKWDFWSIRPPKLPPWTCKDPLWGIPRF